MPDFIFFYINFVADIGTGMNILINCTILRNGGSVQVGDSVCRLLCRYSGHRFVVVMPPHMTDTVSAIEHYRNVRVFIHSVDHSLLRTLRGRERFLDSLVERFSIDCVLSVFGPSRWRPRVPHISGYGRPHPLLPDSPYFKRMSWPNRLANRLKYRAILAGFARDSDYIFTENEHITQLLRRRILGRPITTVTNCCNQVFDMPERWTHINLRPFDGIRVLSVTAFYPHKNLDLIVEMARLLRREHPGRKVRFVLSLDSDCLGPIEPGIQGYFEFLGPVPLSACPLLYKDCDISLQTSLLECFSANYVEAMKMGRPQVVTNLGFARGICGDAAAYFEPASARSAVETLLRVADDEVLRRSLVESGRRRLSAFGTSEMRADRLIDLCRRLVREKTGE